MGFLQTHVTFGDQCGSDRYVKHLEIVAKWFSVLRNFEDEFQSRESVCNLVMVKVADLYSLATEVAFVQPW